MWVSMRWQSKSSLRNCATPWRVIRSFRWSSRLTKTYAMRRWSTSWRWPKAQGHNAWSSPRQDLPKQSPPAASRRSLSPETTISRPVSLHNHLRDTIWQTCHRTIAAAFSNNETEPWNFAQPRGKVSTAFALPQVVAGIRRHLPLRGACYGTGALRRAGRRVSLRHTPAQPRSECKALCHHGCSCVHGLLMKSSQWDNSY